MGKMILFVDRFHDLSHIAENAALRESDGAFSITSAGLEPRRRFTGCGDGAGTVDFASVAATCFDLVITLGKEAADRCALPAGLPAIVHWDDMDAPDEASFRDKTVLIDERVHALFNHGFCSALLRHHARAANIIDSLREGIIAHGLGRRIFLFSKGAERITGASCDEIVGRDCHELFQPRLCGESCVFRDGDLTSEATIESVYQAHFLAGDGSNRQFDMTRLPLLDEQGMVIGALVTFTDSTKLRDLEQRLGETESFAGIIGRDHRMLEIYGLIRDLADSDFPVVINGESGTGKELVAAAIHNESLRRDGLFVPVNCGALPEGTLESELFGHVRGSFTGAIRDKKGRFELADRGTLFLDEIGDLSLAMQVKLLRVLQEGIVEPVGSETTRKVDVRVVCATNRNLKEMVARGTFREDLYYRLAVVPIELPPLRERRNDIPLLARNFLDKTTGRLGRGSMLFSDDTLSVLMNYAWPGNVRQLQNAIQFALIKCRSATILPEHLPPEILAATYVPVGIQHTPGRVGRRPKLTNEIVERALEKAGGNKAKAARLLGVGRATLYNFMNSREPATAVAD
ncbi:MAG: sigma 54-interacting transcriptional regulator [Chitinispirillaceae bacterium]|nr:sigma 54-interacting transcriptional regulator [Chitinispirillaceae bacterium]